MPFFSSPFASDRIKKLQRKTRKFARANTNSKLLFARTNNNQKANVRANEQLRRGIGIMPLKVCPKTDLKGQWSVSEIHGKKTKKYVRKHPLKDVYGKNKICYTFIIESTADFSF